MELKGRVVLVTGASRGIGRAIALAFAGRGACVVGTGRDRKLLAELAATLRQGHADGHVLGVELTEPGACERLVGDVVQRHGRLDVLVNNAGVATAERIEDVTLEHWRRMMAVNVEAPMLLMREAVKVMRRQNEGRIINVASDAAVRGIGRMATYCASKHALLGFGRALNQELHGTPMRVTTLCPGPVTTGIMGGSGNPDAIAPADVADAAVLAATLTDRSHVAEMLVLPTRV